MYFSADVCQQWHFLEGIFLKYFDYVYSPFFFPENILILLRCIVMPKKCTKWLFLCWGLCRFKVPWVRLWWSGWGRLWMFRQRWWCGSWNTGGWRRSVCKRDSGWSQVIHGPDGPGTSTYKHCQKFHHPEANGLCSPSFPFESSTKDS